MARRISEISELKSEQSQLSRKGDVRPFLEQKKKVDFLIISSMAGDFKGKNKVGAPDAQALTEWSDADIRQD